MFRFFNIQDFHSPYPCINIILLHIRSFVMQITNLEKVPPQHQSHSFSHWHDMALYLELHLMHDLCTNDWWWIFNFNTIHPSSVNNNDAINFEDFIFSHIKIEVNSECSIFFYQVKVWCTRFSIIFNGMVLWLRIKAFARLYKLIPFQCGMITSMEIRYFENIFDWWKPWKCCVGDQKNEIDTSYFTRNWKWFI